MNSEAPREDNFANQLIAAQQVEPTLRQRHEEEIRAMLEQSLTPKRKIAFTASAVLCAVMAVMLTIAALSSHGAPVGVRIGVGMGAIYAAGWLVISLRILRRGTFRVRSDWKTMSAWPWVFVIVLVTLILVMTGQRSDSVKSIWLLLYGLTFLLCASVFLIQYWIGDARMKLEERMLELQLRVAELAEELKKRE